MKRKIIKYFRIWRRTLINSFTTSFYSRTGAVFFLLGKFIRFFMFFFFLLLATQKSGGVASYNVWQVLLFFLTFNLIDILSQMFFRGVYRFRPLVIEGGFDLILTKPISPLFRVLIAWTDFLDMITLFPLGILFILVFSKLGPVSFSSLLLYFLLILTGLIIATAIHVLILAFGILTTEVDHTVWIYRDILNTGRIPIDVYQEPIRALLTFIFPVAIMVTFPVKALFGLLSPFWVIFSMLFAALIFYLSLRIWNFALRKYQSASS